MWKAGGLGGGWTMEWGLLRLAGGGTGPRHPRVQGGSFRHSEKSVKVACDAERSSRRERPQARPRDPLTSPRASPPGRAKGVDGRRVAGACGRSAPGRPLPRRPSRARLEHAGECGGAGVAQFVGYQRHRAPEREFALGDEHALIGEVVADAAAHVAAEGGGEARSEERRGGKECGSTFRAGGTAT